MTCVLSKTHWYRNYISKSLVKTDHMHIEFISAFLAIYRYVYGELGPLDCERGLIYMRSAYLEYFILSTDAIWKGKA